MPVVRIITLGCAKNDVDSEEIAGVLQSAGFEINAAADYAAYTIINTCGFLRAAKEEGIQVIREAVKEKRSGRTGKVVVAGCLVQREGDAIQKAAPGADAYVGVGRMGEFAEILRALDAAPPAKPVMRIPTPHHEWTDRTPRVHSGPPWRAYLKVSEGCDHRCTFCTIPSFRGRHSSKRLEVVLDEAKRLADQGVREINLIAQDVTQYGYDLYQKFMLPQLLKELNRVEGIEWIRILYFYPNRLTDEVIEAMASLEHVLPYIDIPLQHVHPEILRAMKRPWDGERYLRLFEKLRAAMPDCAIRTTFIVGFPGETDEHFAYLLDWLRQACLDRVGAFLYSREPGTPAAEMPNQVPARIKRQRYDALMRTQQRISLEKNQAWIGRKLDVLIEAHAEDGLSIGRSFRDAPEIDGVVYVEGHHRPGEFVNVEITGAAEYDLFGRMP
ncbi:MAG: 30S ribosomal protein S12 methylthiotransferase RimO [Armatimonadetes bacterium]|nr:MAG: 30S ribosomal protein S12 methylthiotransferase RimO [Armatimonadota bacterium]